MKVQSFSIRVGHSSGHAIIDIKTMVEISCIEVMRAVVGRLS